MSAATLTGFPNCDPPAPEAVTLAVPEFEGHDLVIDTSGLPEPYEFVPVGDPPELEVPELPDKFEYTPPPDPAIIKVDIPKFDPLEPVEFDVTVPTPNIPELTNDLQWEHKAFDQTKLAQIQQQLERVRSGEFAISSDLWHQIYLRAAQKVHREGLARRRQARETWANLGWSMPGGVALSAEAAARRETQQEISKHALETATKEAEHKDEQVWKAIAEGLKVEAQLHEVTKTRNEQTLQFAIQVQQASVAAHKAIVEAFNAQLAKANADIQVVGARLEQQKAELSNRKMQLDAAVAAGEVNKVRAEVYRAHWEGIKAASDAYIAEVQAIGAKVDTQKAAIEAHGAKVAQKKMEVDTWVARYDGYAKKMQGESLKVDYFGQLVNKYAARINAYDVQVRGLETGERSKGALAQAAASCSGAAASWHKADIDAAIGNLQHQQSMVRVAIEQQEADTKDRSVDNQYSVDTTRLGNEFFLGQADIAVRRDELNLRGALGFAEFENNKEVAQTRADATTESADISGRYGVQEAQITSDARRYVADQSYHGQIDSANIQADATVDAACIRAKADVGAAQARVLSEQARAEMDADARIQTSKAETAARIKVAAADANVRAQIAMADMNARIAAANASSHAQIEAAKANAHHTSYSESLTQTNGSNTYSNNYVNNTHSNDWSNRRTCSDATYNNTYNNTSYSQ